MVTNPLSAIAGLDESSALQACIALPHPCILLALLGLKIEQARISQQVPCMRATMQARLPDAAPSKACKEQEHTHATS
jgi:hypothetical protein